MSQPDYVRAQRGGKPEAKRSVIFTVLVGEERFGLLIDHVRTVFRAGDITPVPLAPAQVMGLINLRGHVVSAVCLAACMGLPRREHGERLMVALEHRGQGFALAVDQVGDVITVCDDDLMAMPATISPSRRAVTSAVYRARDVIIPVLDLDVLLGEPEDRRDTVLAA